MLRAFGRSKAINYRLTFLICFPTSLTQRVSSYLINGQGGELEFIVAANRNEQSVINNKDSNKVSYNVARLVLLTDTN